MRLSRLKRANVPYIANDVEHQLATAPGAPEPELPPTKQRLNKLEQLDANIRKCAYCGKQIWKIELCSLCQEKYPVIDDFERTA